MGIAVDEEKSRSGAWDASEIAALTAKTTWGLEPFVFDPGPVTTQAELQQAAEKSLRSDKGFNDIVQARKAEITGILQGCLDRVNEQLERGEAVCEKAHFPLLQGDVDFEDLEGLANHDFTVDLHIDEVDHSLQELVTGLMNAFWSKVAVENTTQVRALERHNEALRARMETLEHHLNDRSRQLSNCRFAYFLEITHLRNQVYIQKKEGDNFEPVEAYFFDPSEHLEEGLRQQLNDKITWSVRRYHDELCELKKRCAQLELDLETATGDRFDPSKSDDLQRILRSTVTKFGGKKVVEGLETEAPTDMERWAEKWLASRGGQTGGGRGGSAALSVAESDRMRDALLRAGAESKEERRLRERAEEELERLRRELQGFREGSGGGGGSAGGMQRSITGVQPQGLGDTDSMDELRKQVAMLKLNLEKLQQRAETSEQKAIEAAALSARSAKEAAEAQAEVEEYRRRERLNMEGAGKEDWLTFSSL